MSQVAPSKKSAKVALPLKPRETTRLRATKVDFVASWLMAFLMFAGLALFALLLIFISRTWRWENPPGSIELVENVAGRGDHAEGFARDLEPPGAEEVEELTEPTLAESLEAVTSAVTNVAASLDTLDSNTVDQARGKGRGDSRPPGPLGEGEDIIPRFERWELKFESKNLAGYSSQLDFFKIELGAAGGGIQDVDYAFGFGASPKKRSGPGDQDKRLNFRHSKASVHLQYDRQLLQRAGVSTDDRVVFKFIPKDLENSLAVLELDYAKSKGVTTVKNIAKTIFESEVVDGSGYKWTVVDQRYRVAK